jgi:metal-dependent hydrolase (beta-lactamase superfamily II)
MHSKSFSALVEADGHRILLDTGSHPETVLQNARDLNIDLSDVEEVILTHNHWDHVRGLMTLRREMMKKNPSALSVLHVSRGIFYSRPSPKGEQNDIIVIRKDYEASGGKIIEHSEGAEIFPGVWLTGPVPRKYPEHNWSVSGEVQTPNGLVEDNIPEDQSLVLNTPQGLVVVTGCGHAGVGQYIDRRGRAISQPASVRRRGRHAPVPCHGRTTELDGRQAERIQSCEPTGSALHWHRSGVPPAGTYRTDTQVGGRGQCWVHVHACRRHSSRGAGEVVVIEYDCRGACQRQKPRIVSVGCEFLRACSRVVDSIARKCP